MLKRLRSLDYKELYVDDIDSVVTNWCIELRFGRFSKPSPSATEEGVKAVTEEIQGLILSPPFAKALHEYLGLQLGVYEEAYGKIANRPKDAQSGTITEAVPTLPDSGGQLKM
jgi:hypothetical protein